MADNQHRGERHFVVCVRNDDHPASLELRKLYEVVPDAQAEARGQLRVIDESGEDYLFPRFYFLEFEIPEAVENVLRRAS